MFPAYLGVAKQKRTTASPKDLSTLFHEAHFRRALRRRHRQCPDHGIPRSVCPVCIGMYCVLCDPLHIGSHDTTFVSQPSGVNARARKTLARMPIKTPRTPIAPSLVVLPGRFTRLVKECTTQKVRIIAFTPPSELVVPITQGERMDDICHQLGYRVVSMTEYQREHRTVFLLEK